MSDVASLFKELEKQISGDIKNERKAFNLLYRARGTISAELFHQKCDSKGPTVTLLHGKLNTLFGGYTSQNWTSDDTKTVKSDKNAFLFYKNDHAEAKCHFLPVKASHQDKAITCDANFGPTFGSASTFNRRNYDLQTFVNDKTNEVECVDGYLNLNGTMNIKYAYNKETTRPLPQGEQFDADINGGKLIVKAFEVYQVVDDLLTEPWRCMPKDSEVDVMRKELENLEPLLGLGLDEYNILLIGIIGAGKSSFFNTLATAFAKKVKSHAIVGEEAESITNEVHAYKLVTDKGKELKLRIYDIRGFEDKRGYDHELELLLEGRLPVGFTFPEVSSPISADELNAKKGLKHEMHLVCFVVDATSLDIISDEVYKRIGTIKKVIRRKDMPMVSVTTKFDNLCPRISEDADNVYNSPKAKAVATDVSSKFGVKLKHVFPVVNYVDETTLKKGKDRLAVQALSSMVQLIVDYLQLHKGMATKCDRWAQRSNHIKVSPDSERNLQTLSIDDLLSDLEGKQLNVLCVGYIHSGKSSFIDAISSCLTGKISTRVSKGFTCDDQEQTSPESTTEKFEMYRIKYKNDAGKPLPTNVSFGDLPGFQKDGGMTYDHAKLVVNGNVANKYEIKQGINKQSKKYIKKPTKEKKIHCICYVFDVCTADSLEDDFVTKFKDFQTWVRKKGIPNVVILTKGDRLSDVLEQNCLQVFKHEGVKKGVEKLKEKFNFFESRMFPVINYVHQSHVVPDMDALLSDVFKEILDLGKEYLEDAEESEEEDENCDDDNE